MVDTPGKYQITTPDNLQYGIDYRQIKTQAEIDLAVLQFTSNQNYSVAQFGDSTQITPGTTIHITGYPDPFPGLPERSYYYASAEVNTVLTTGDKGYTIVHDNPGSPGTSGGAILDENGLLIGINGKITSDSNIGKAFGLAIPLQLYLDQKNSLSM